MRILGIETSCDETSASVLEGTGNDVRMRSLVILSQDVHRVFGGVVPEIASRAHLTSLVPVVERALADAQCGITDIDAIGVTHAPGLIGALLVGVNYAKGIAFARGIPLLGTHHLEGHIFAQSLDSADAVPPFTCLLVSGGHTLLLDVAAWGEYTLLGRTRDDAAGEAFDKVAKLLGLPYPGGPHVERVARDSDGAGFRFARPMLHAGQTAADPDYYDVSFSGLKTAVRRAVQHEVTARGDAALPDGIRAGIARAFQDALIETLVEKTARAARGHGRTRIVLGGGVACNAALVDAMRARAASFSAHVFAPSARLATDNAAMIARAAMFHFERGTASDMSLTAHAARDIPGLRTAA
jgi:N6-L-threonylcarbamoyladenine synthase